jgi:hypothetical protein
MDDVNGHCEVSRSEMRDFVFASLRLPTLRVGPRFVLDQGNRGPAAKQWGLSTRSGAKKTRGCAEAYCSTSPVCRADTGRHKQHRSLTKRLGKRTISGWKLVNLGSERGLDKLDKAR